MNRIWGESLLIYDSGQNPANLSGETIRIYLGDEAQTPDSLFSTVRGATLTPAYRGLAYVVFDTLDCSPWGNRLPSFNFEVVNIVPYDQLILDTANLYLYYSFDLDTGQLVDQGVHSYTLSVASGSVSTQTPGHANEALAFGTGAVVQNVMGSDLNFQNAQITVEGWFQFKGDPVVNGAAHFSYTNPTTGELAWRLWVNPNAILEQVNLSFRVFTNGSGVVDVFSIAVTRDTLWHQLVVTYDETGYATLYYDSVALQTTASPVDPITITASAGNKIVIDGGDFHWDELAFYTRILTPLEVYNHFQGKGSTTGTILADVFNQCGLPANNYDVSQAIDYVTGFLLHTRQDARTQVQELLRLYDLDLVERDGKLVALKRGGSSFLTVPAIDLGAHVTTGAETDPPVKVTVKRLPEMELPQRLDLRYYDIALNYEMGLQGASRFTKSGEVQEALTIQSTLVFQQDDARQRAEKELYRQWIEREQYNYNLGPAYLQLTPGDIVTVPTGSAGTLRRTRVVAADLGLIGPIQFQGVLDDASLLTQSALGQPLTPPTQIQVASTTNLQVFSTNALRDADAQTIGFYGAGGAPASLDWPGAGLYTSLDAGGSYQRLANMTQPADMGTANTALANWTGGDVWDTTNTVDLLLTNGNPPLSTSDSDVLAGSNGIQLGTEILQYATVTPQGGGVYRLSRLLRGRRGTEQHMGEHQVGESWVLLSDQTVTHYVMNSSLAGKSILVKAVTLGQTLAGVTAVPVWIGGYEEWEYSVVDVTASRNGGLDLIVVFVPRARFSGEMHDGSDISLTATPESYTMGIFTNLSNNITAITQDPVSALVTSPSHGFSNGNTVFFWQIQGMTQLNGLLATISSVTTNTFQINIATAGMSAFIASGSPLVQPIIRQITAVSAGPTVTYTNGQQTTDFGAPQGSIKVALWQNGIFGKGYYSGPFTF